jgi:2-dehydropantoate 2-reductase
VIDIRPEDLVVRSPADVAVADRTLERFMSKMAATKASMLQGLQRGAATEVDVINGGVTGTEARLGLPAPLNARLVELVRACE